MTTLVALKNFMNCLEVLKSRCTMLFEYEINESHVMHSEDSIKYDAESLAMELVGERYSKREFVNLVRWLIMDEAKCAREKLFAIKR